MTIDALPAGTPDETGLLDDLFARIDAHYRERVDRGEMAGIVYAVARHGKIAHAQAIGYADIAGGRPATLDTVFRAFSMTKPITAVALMMLYDEGRFDLDDPIAHYLPEFAEMRVLRSPIGDVDDTVPLERAITVRDIFRHTAGFGLGLGLGGTSERILAEAEPYNSRETLADEMTKIARVPLAGQPGAAWSYSLSPDLQARMVEVLSGQTFGSFLQERLFTPLGMHDTAFAPRADMIERLTRLYWRGGDGLRAWTNGDAPPVPPPLTSWPIVFAHVDDPSMVWERGSFGLYTTLDDYLRFAQMLLDGGTYRGECLLRAETVRLMASDHLGDIPMLFPVQGLGFGLGMAVIRDTVAHGAPSTAGTFYWDGAAGTVFWIDPENDMIVVALVQHLMVPGLDPQSVAAELRRLLYPVSKRLDR